MFTIKLSYNAVIELSVEAEDEGKAMDKAREIAESADIRQFSIFGENNAEVLSRG